jgi:tRNA pseudouridine55 synthase
MAASAADGFLLIDKPAGCTSQDVVAAVRRGLSAKRAGHTGTLDPFATGLLIVLVGSATRLARFLPSEPKTYEAAIRFGSETDTGDGTGSVVRHAEAPDETRVMDAIARLTGSFEQVPPAYSAKQVGGQRAYAMAREGRPLSLSPVTVRVDEWQVVRHDGACWQARITVGSGTYIRALARDLGRLTNSAAHLTALRRVRIGPFEVNAALTLARVREAVTPMPAADALVNFPRARLDETEVALVRQGHIVHARIPGARAALVDGSGALVAVAERCEDGWQPRVVLADA